MKTAIRIQMLLDEIVADFPNRKRKIEEMMKKYGMDESVSLRIEPPKPVTVIPTFGDKYEHKLTPMLKARFDYASTVEYAGETWLAANEMQRKMKYKDVKSYHKALRENWEGSAPMLYGDDQLSIFGVTEGVPDNLTYLVWSTESGEPRVWRYAGLNSYEFNNLEEFLSWFMKE